MNHDSRNQQDAHQVLGTHQGDTIQTIATAYYERALVHTSGSATTHGQRERMRQLNAALHELTGFETSKPYEVNDRAADLAWSFDASSVARESSVTPDEAGYRLQG
jgi:hypothetical protein